MVVGSILARIVALQVEVRVALRVQRIERCASARAPLQGHGDRSCEGREQAVVSDDERRLLSDKRGHVSSLEATTSKRLLSDVAKCHTVHAEIFRAAASMTTHDVGIKKPAGHSRKLR